MRIKSFETLKNRKDFEQVYGRGKKRFTSSLVIYYIPREQKRIGLTVSKKVGKAVARNYAKRRIRAIIARNDAQIRSGEYVIVAKSAIISQDFSRIEAEFLKAMKVLGAIA